ncbi:MAG TPA: M23 family metallopeptidase [Symbiobacteriaceae bacterium]|nr:M23 family metallopeptidase [Symbiobacteriaceae bacterium]
MMSGERQVREVLERFRESRLFLQVAASVGLVAVTGLVTVLPAAPVARVRQGLVWTVTHDYDFAGRWAEANRWAGARGGWRRLLTPAPPPAVTPTVTPTVPPAAAPAPADEAEDPATQTVMPVNGRVLYGFGWLPKGQEPHGGLDLSAAVGAPVVAMHDGTVLRAGTDPAIGGLVEVDHGFVVALYGQVGGVKVRPGDKVKKGQTLATVAKPTGKEGNHGAHLHLEVRASRGGKTVDPAPFLPLSAQGGDGN